jgi:hypothetical protein
MFNKNKAYRKMEKKQYQLPSVDVDQMMAKELFLTVSKNSNNANIKEDILPGNGTGSSTPRTKERGGIWGDEGELF